MKHLFIVSVIMAILLLFSACQQPLDHAPRMETEEPFDLEAIIQSMPIDPDVIASEILDRTGWRQTEKAAAVREKAWVRPGTVLSYDKTYLNENVAHYTFIIATGPGKYDKIGLHRVVRESAGGQPMRAQKALFHLHGSGNEFATVMLPGVGVPLTPDDAGISVYLAEHGVDVWGIDQAWSLVPAEVTDHSFMADWGMDRQVRDSRIGLAVARILRFRTGSGIGRMLLSGHSSGVFTGYALLNEEAAMAPRVRQVDGFIPMDGFVMIDNDHEDLRAEFTSNYESTTALIESGSYAVSAPFHLIGNLAIHDPGGASPIIPGFTNEQAAIFLFAGRPNPGRQFLAGTWENGLPTGFKYVDTGQALEIYLKTVPYQAARYNQDYSLWVGEIEDAPWDDHFADIRAPILSIDPAGGFGKVNEYTTSFLGSSDITHLSIQLLEDGQEPFDYGHIDIFLANNAEELVWEPILAWIESH